MSLLYGQRPWIATVLFLLVLLFGQPLPAQNQSRAWKDKTGSFEVNAQLVKWSNGHVLLLKPDGKVVSIAETDLSADDRKYLESLGVDNPFAGGRRMTQEEIRRVLESPDILLSDWSAKPLPAGGKAITFSEEKLLPAIQPDPPISKPGFVSLSCQLEEVDHHARVSAPVLIDKKNLTFAVSIYRNAPNKRSQTFGRLYLVSSGKDKPQKVIDMDQSITVLDHHIPSSRTLALVNVGAKQRKSGDLVLLEGLAKGTPKALMRWQPPGLGKDGYIDSSMSARFIDGDRMIVRIRDSIHIVSLKSKKALFRIDGLQTGAKTKLSPGRRYLLIPSSRRIDVVDTREGKWLGTIKVPIYSTLNLAFSPSGDRLAIVGGNHYFIWDFKFGKFVNQFVVGNAAGKLIGWVDDQLLLSQLGGLIDVGLGISIWSYHLPSGRHAQPLPRGIALLESYGQPISFNCLPIPHQSVRKIIEQVDGAPENKFLLVKKGTPVRVRVEVPKPHDGTEVLKALNKTVAKAGWKVVDKSDIEIVCRLVQGEQESVHFSDLFQLGGSRMEVKLKPMYATLEVRAEGFTVWSRKRIGTIPPTVYPEEGQTIAQAVMKYERPTTDFLKFQKLPTRILRPDFADYVGKSYLDKGKWVDR